MKGSEFLLDVFRQEEISHVFLVPGGYIDPIISALKNVPEVKGIVAAHEGGAVFMADGYARLSDKFGVALGIGGPGVTNMMTGIASAYTDQIPLFVITGETKTFWEGRGAFQDSSSGGINDASMLQSITVKKLAVPHIQSLEHHVKFLLRAMLNHTQQGPVHLSFPANIQTEEHEFHYKKMQKDLYHPRFLNEESFNKIEKLIEKKPNIVILAGTGVLHSQASKSLLQLAEQFDIPVATTLTAKGVFPEDHRLSLGVFGWFGSNRATQTMLSKKIDVLIVLGSKMNQMETMVWSENILPKHALIVNDISESGWFANYDPDLFVLGDANQFLEALLKQKKIFDATKEERKEWIEEFILNTPKFCDEENLTTDMTPIHPARIIHDLRNVSPKDTILFVGEGAHGFFATHYWTSFSPQQFFIAIKFMSAMGWSIPASIGAKFARPNQPVVCITGDGSIMMHGMEIQTAARYELPIIFIVFNNQSHGNPQLRGKRVGKFECEFLKLPNHDWAKFGESLGAVGMRVDKPEELKSTFEKAFKLNKTVVIDIASGNYQTPTYAFDEYMYQVKK